MARDYREVNRNTRQFRLPFGAAEPFPRRALKIEYCIRFSCAAARDGMSRGTEFCAPGFFIAWVAESRWYR